MGGGGVVELGTGDATAIADVVRALPSLRVRGYDVSAPRSRRRAPTSPPGA
ncbi:hypothetical protein [Blastococcus brunescens]|uniref:Uncharacterized protein n=1 Tax=Blastococcus brunescens TaxID=1564165 RepID=A0ABZ1B699_9ACTN|nr:hypothetical protein [Blastococcus sp. BMG 8361]WRL66324.1 hypothetical protein U6N30_13300 [Blastococcus sp. BMG 8361]